MKTVVIIATLFIGSSQGFNLRPVAPASRYPKLKSSPSLASDNDSSTVLFHSGLNSNLLAETIQPTSTQIPPSIPTSTAVVDGTLSASTNTIVFIIGLIPFLWATYEFWSRIAVGASFGTGADSIQIRPQSEEMKQLTTIGKDGDLKKSRGQRVLGDDALIVAYILFAIAIASVGIAVYSVVSSPMDL